MTVRCWRQAMELACVWKWTPISMAFLASVLRRTWQSPCQIYSKHIHKLDKEYKLDLNIFVDDVKISTYVQNTSPRMTPTTTSISLWSDPIETTHFRDLPLSDFDENSLYACPQKNLDNRYNNIQTYNETNLTCKPKEWQPRRNGNVCLFRMLLFPACFTITACKQRIYAILGTSIFIIQQCHWIDSRCCYGLIYFW